MMQYDDDLKPPARALCAADCACVWERPRAQTRFVGMMQYDGDLKLPARFLVPPPAIHGVSGELLARAGASTFACSETQKFGHVRAPAAPLACCMPSWCPARVTALLAIDNSR
jgi:bisphosphoglycerate-independent phosphoglycerate mutase (AlkP superfamily)